MIHVELIDDLNRAEALYPGWDSLAVANGLPTMAPAWILAWWRHFAPPGALPRIVAVHDDEQLVGLAPFFVDPSAHRAGRVDYRLPGIELAVRLAPLAVSGREWMVAEAIGSVLARAQPRPDVVALEGLTVDTEWHRALRDSWPGSMRPISRTYSTAACPTVSLTVESYEAWLGGKSAHFRERMRKTRRRFEQAGGTWRFSTGESLVADLQALVRLHTERWSSRGGSSLDHSGGRVASMLEDAGRRLLQGGRFRLMVLEIDGEAVDVHLAVAAGGEVLGVNGGWDERWGRLSPTTVHTLYLIEDAIGRGDRRFDLGPGDQPFKTRLADGNDPVGWTVMLPPGRRLVLAGILTAPVVMRQAAKRAARRRLTGAQIQRIRSLALRQPGGREPRNPAQR